MNDLLVDPLFTLETAAGARQASLPGLLAALGGDEVLSYPAVRRHQQDPFRVFLCQIVGDIGALIRRFPSARDYAGA